MQKRYIEIAIFKQKSYSIKTLIFGGLKLTLFRRLRGSRQCPIASMADQSGMNILFEFDAHQIDPLTCCNCGGRGGIQGSNNIQMIDRSTHSLIIICHLVAAVGYGPD